MHSIELVSNGNDFNGTLSIGNDAGSNGIFNINGTMGCASGLLEVSLGDFGNTQCTQVSLPSPIPNLCEDYLPEKCTAVYPYSTYETSSGLFELQITGFCGISGDVYLKCIGTCFGEVRCSPVEAITVLESGTLIVNNSNVIIDNGDNITAFFYGPINLLESNNINLIFGNETTEFSVNILGDENTFNVNSPATTYNIITNEAGPCRGWADWMPTRSTNLTITTASDTLITMTGGVLVTPTDWDLASASQLRYIGDEDNGETGYAMTYCINTGVLYGSVGEGQRILIKLYNATSVAVVSATSVASAPLIYNHTNPAFIGSACATLITDGIYPQNAFSLYARLERTDGASGTAIIGANARYSLTVAPLACRGFELTINLSAIFNVSRLIADECITIEYMDEDQTVHIGSTAPCGTEAEGTCSDYLELDIDANVLSYNFSGMGAPVDSDTITWTNLGSCGWRADATAIVTTENFTNCANCTSDGNGNYTLQVSRLCSARPQCEVSSDPPESSEASLPLPCFFASGSVGSCEQNSGDSSGGGGNGGGGGGSPIPPPILPLGFVPIGVPIVVLPIIPIFPPIVAPIVTLPVGAVPVVRGGTWIPEVNFTVAVPYCHNETDPRGDQILVNTGIQPNVLEVCQVIDTAGTRGWQPYCPCSNINANTIAYISNTTNAYVNGSTLIISSDSQFISGGTNILGSLQVCLAGGTNTTTTQIIESCDGNAVSMPDGVTADFVLSDSTITATDDLIGLAARVDSITDRTLLDGPTMVFGAYMRFIKALLSNPIDIIGYPAITFPSMPVLNAATAGGGFPFAAGTQNSYAGLVQVDITGGTSLAASTFGSITFANNKATAASIIEATLISPISPCLASTSLMVASTNGAANLAVIRLFNADPSTPVTTGCVSIFYRVSLYT